MDDLLKDLLNNIKVLDDHSMANYQPLEYERIEAISHENTSKGAALIDGEWFPKSQLACNVDGDLFVTNWFLSKIIR